MVETNPTDISGYEGKQNEIKDMVISEPLQAVEYVYKGQGEVAHYETDELSAICPKTGLPDFYTLRIMYTPLEKLCELKSLKLYLTAYRSIGIFHEHLAQKIMNDFIKVVEPQAVRVILEAKPRGGIKAIVDLSRKINSQGQYEDNW